LVAAPSRCDGIGDLGIIQIGYGTSLEGRVLDEFGVPLPGIVVSATLASSSSRASRETTIDGRYSFHNIPPGTAYLTIGGGNWVPQTISGIILESGTPIELPDVILQLGGTVTGHICRAGGVPAAAVFVKCGPVTTATDASGVYLLEGAPPGNRQLIVGYQGSVDYAQEPVTVISGQTVVLDVYLP
jgi:hypothetical protein